MPDHVGMSQPALRYSTLAEIPLRRWAILGAPALGSAHVRRLAELGLRSGSRVLVLHNAVGGGRVVAVDQGRVALDHATCCRIPVTVAAR